MKNFAIDLVLWVLASPVLLLKRVIRLVEQIRFYRTAYSSEIKCRHCGAMISLVNVWRCACGATVATHLLRPCGICGSVPRLVRCNECGATELLPEP